MNALTMDTWQLFNVKNHLSRVVESAASAPQTITVRGKKKAVILSYDEYQKLTKPKQSIVETLSGIGFMDADEPDPFLQNKTPFARGTPLEVFD